MTAIQKSILIFISMGILFYIIPFHMFIDSDNNENEYHENKLKFDKKRWVVHWNKHHSGENERHFMLYDLMQNHLKTGMDSIEVKKMLGNPERDFGFSYNLGFYRSGFDSTFLILEFDAHGKLKSKKIETI